MRDLYNRVSVVRVLDPVARANGTYNGVTVDRQNSGKLSQSCLFVQNIGTKTDGVLTAALKESDTGVFAGEENDVASTDLSGSLSDLNAADAGAGQNTVAKLGYRGAKRYLRLIQVVSADAGSNNTFGVVAVLGHIGHNAAV
jgi:hypothetical protein